MLFITLDLLNSSIKYPGSNPLYDPIESIINPFCF